MRTSLRPELEFITPARMRTRPLDPRGYPVPWFSARLEDGSYDLRVADADKIEQAVRFKLCWICGEPLGRRFAFVIGPMCAINRISSEPPQHVECSLFAAKACPFLARPKAGRRDANLPEEVHAGPGIPLLHNPGVTLVWACDSYQLMRARGERRALFVIGEPYQLWWFAEGRTATRVEVDAAIEKGLPHLRRVAKEDGPMAETELEIKLTAAQRFLPTTV